jgi:prevent-host-death family protein
MMTRVSVSQASRNLSHWINRAAYGGDTVILESHGRPKAVLMSLETFEGLLGIRQYLEQEPLPAAELQVGLRHAFDQAGYRTEEDILGLIREVKEEMAAELFAAES